MIFSRACEHGLRAMIYVAAHSGEGGHPVLVRDIAEALDIPAPSLAKVVQKLTRRGLLTSQKGPGGGIALARPAEHLTLLEVVEAVEDRNLSRACMLGLSGCTERTSHCPVHEQWTVIREHLVQVLRDRSIAAVAEQMATGEFVLRAEALPASGRRARPPQRKPTARQRGSATRPSAT